MKKEVKGMAKTKKAREQEAWTASNRSVEGDDHIDYLSVDKWLEAEIKAVLEGELTGKEAKFLEGMDDYDWSLLKEAAVEFWESEYRDLFVDHLRERLAEIARDEGIDLYEEDEEEEP
jgi:hypothetical protein